MDDAHFENVERIIASWPEWKRNLLQDSHKPMRSTPRPPVINDEVDRLKAEIERLKRGDFTEDEFQNLCHKFDDSDAKRFVEGCRQYQDKLFGCERMKLLREESEK